MIKKEPKFKLNQGVDFDGKKWFVKRIIIENIISKHFSPGSFPFYVPDEFNNQDETKQIYYILEDYSSREYKLTEFDLEKGFSGNFRSLEEKKAAQLKESLELMIGDLKSKVNSKLGMIFWCFVPLYIGGFYILGHMLCK